jgi:hypothetical protein
MIMDLVPTISKLFFERRFPLRASLTQCAILIGMGLQHKTVDAVSAEL